MYYYLCERSPERSHKSQERYMAQRHSTLKDVATSAGVSYQTVSKVINHQVQVTKETEERIWQAVESLNYRPNHTARALRSQRSFTLGYSWPPSPHDQANPILDQFLQSIFEAAEARGYYLLCFPYHADPQEQLSTYGELIDTGRVDGFILSSVEYQDPRVLLLLDHHFPFVAFGRSDPELIFPWIDVDGAAGIAMVVSHLLELGHTRIGALAWPENSRVGNNRMEGYFQTLQAVGITPEPDWIARGEGRFSFGFEATLKMLNLPVSERPTALVALNDPMAVGAMQAARERGIAVGTQLAIASFDDAPMVQYLNPPLTSVRQPVWEVGQRIIPMLLGYIETGLLPEPMSVLVTPELIVRESTGGQIIRMEGGVSIPAQ
jgi:DNA-binding LacI/PurR family transcriptional regulator